MALSGCVATTSPRIKVLGVQKAPHEAPRQSLLVFVEVVNPTQRDIKLSRLEYRVSARPWFEGAGKVNLSREIGAGESAVVEVPVPVARAEAAGGDKVPYTLEGKLFAREDKLERSWTVAVHGQIGRSSAASQPIRVTAAGID